MNKHRIDINRIVKIGVIILVISCLITVFCSTVTADESGKCGASVSWELSNGNLIISGKGAMYDFPEETMAPWYNSRNSIVSVYIEDGITNIGELAFYDCENLSRVRLPDSITKINDLAFAECKNLTTVFLGNNVEKIGKHAFEACTSLKSINLPDGLFEIGYHAFYRCESLTSISIPDTVYEMGAGVFAYCSNLLQVRIDAWLQSLPTWTFYGCESLVSVTLPSSIENIDTYAFKGCDSLSSAYYGGYDSIIPNIDAQIKNDVPSFTGVQSPSNSNKNNAAWNGTETNNDGSISDIQKEVQDTDNSTIHTNITTNKPAVEQSGNNECDIVVDATIRNEDGWKELNDKLDSVVKYPEVLSNNNTTVNPIEVNLQLKNDVSIKSDDLEKWVGKKIHLNIYTTEGSYWSIRGEDLSDNLSGDYALKFNVSKNESPDKNQKAILGDAISYIVVFEDNVDFKFTVKIQLPIEHVGQYATLYQKPVLNKWEEVQTVIIDREGYACFNLDGVDTETKYMIGINVEGSDIDNAVVPESLYDEYNGLVDENGVKYEITGTKSKFGVSFFQLTLILIGIIVGLFLIIGMVVWIILKTKAKSNTYKSEELKVKNKNVSSDKKKKEKKEKAVKKTEKNTETKKEK